MRVRTSLSLIRSSTRFSVLLRFDLGFRLRLRCLICRKFSRIRDLDSIWGLQFDFELWFCGGSCDLRLLIWVFSESRGSLVVRLSLGFTQRPVEEVSSRGAVGIYWGAYKATGNLSRVVFCFSVLVLFFFLSFSFGHRGWLNLRGVLLYLV